MAYLRQLSLLELEADTKSGLKEIGKPGKRIFIKVISIHPEPAKPARRSRLNRNWCDWPERCLPRNDPAVTVINQGALSRPQSLQYQLPPLRA